LKIIEGNFGNDKKKSLNDKVSEGLSKLKESENISEEEVLRYPFILIVDTGEDLKVVSDVEMEKFNLILDLIKITVLTGAYD